MLWVCCGTGATAAFVPAILALVDGAAAVTAAFVVVVAADVGYPLEIEEIPREESPPAGTDPAVATEAAAAAAANARALESAGPF